jgi:exosome complex component RRP4
MNEKVRKIVLPGEFLSFREGRKLGNYVYQEGEKVFSKVIGIPKILENCIDVIPLAGTYFPKIGDRVIGIVKNVEVSGWFVDINSPYLAFLPLSLAVSEYVDIFRVDLSKYYDVEDVIFCRISKVTKDKIVQVTMKDPEAKKLEGGVLMKITPTKVARLIGKGRSMINLLKEKTKCEILPGQNGVVWLKGDNLQKAIQAILMIERESHIYGLTEKIQKFLSGVNEKS